MLFQQGAPQHRRGSAMGAAPEPPSVQPTNHRHDAPRNGMPPSDDPPNRHIAPPRRRTPIPPSSRAVEPSKCHTHTPQICNPRLPCRRRAITSPDHTATNPRRHEAPKRRTADVLIPPSAEPIRIAEPPNYSNRRTAESTHRRIVEVQDSLAPMRRANFSPPRSNTGS